jgi:uncharacterized cupin superfamily protein
MADVTVKGIDDFEAIYLGSFRKVRAGLGVTSFGIQVFDLPPNFDQYPQHDHGEDGQEEVYTALSGSATLLVDGEEHRLEPGVFARVGPGQNRSILTGSEPVRILAIGGTPGRPYEVQQFTEEGEPDPMAR